MHGQLFLLILHVLCMLKTTFIQINFVPQCVHTHTVTTQLTIKAVAVVCDTTRCAGLIEDSSKRFYFTSVHAVCFDKLTENQC